MMSMVDGGMINEAGTYAFALASSLGDFISEALASFDNAKKFLHVHDNYCLLITIVTADFIRFK